MNRLTVFRKQIIKLSFFIYLFFLTSFSAQAATDILVEGNQRVEPETVLSYLDLSKDFSNDNVVNDAVKILFETGFFADIDYRREGDKLIFIVEENPTIDRVAFEGNNRLTDDQLKAETKVKPRSIYNQATIQSDVARITEIYRQKGRFSAQVEAKLIQKSDNRVDIVFEIREGAKTSISKILFVGNKAFTDSELKDVLLTKEYAWFRFLSSSDDYNPDKLNYDKQQITRFYFSEGYIDFRVVSAIAEFSPEDESFVVTMTVDEGDKYTVGEVSIQSNVEEIDVENLYDFIPFETGDDFNATLTTPLITKMTTYLAGHGHPFVNVKPRLVPNKEENTVNLSFLIEDGERLYVEKINIVGNARTLDEVIRREVLFLEGDPFNKTLVKASERRIKNLGFFKKVEIKTRPGSEPDLMIVEIKIEEQPTGDLGISIGLQARDSSVDPIISLTLAEKNLLGTADAIAFTGNLSFKQQYFNASYTRPYFMDTNIVAGADVFHIITDRKDESSFSTVKTGASLRASYPIIDDLRQFWRYTIQFDELKVQDVAPLDAVREDGSTVRSTLVHSISYDRLDNRFRPRDGYYIQLTNEFAGLGGDVRFLKNTIKALYFEPLYGESVIGSLKANAGYIVDLGQEIRIDDRFFLGAPLVRGFESAGIGPRDAVTGDALGGKLFAALTAEVEFPLYIIPEEFGFRGAIFVDAGILTDPEDSVRKVMGGPGNQVEVFDNVVDSGSIRASAGFGISWASPMGPIRVDFAFPFLSEKEDKEEFFNVNFGTKF